MQDYDITNKDIDNNGYLKQEYPEEIQGYFDCSSTKLKYLKGVPQKIDGYFFCSQSSTISLENGPQRVGKNYNCSHTQITSLMGAPEWANKDFICYATKISSLEGMGRKYLKHCKQMSLPSGVIKQNVLGLLLVKNLEYVEMRDEKYHFDIDPWLEIITHNWETKDILECQEELIQNGFKEYAKL